MLKKAKFFVFFIIVSLFVFSFSAVKLSYSQITCIQTQLLESLLNKQLPNGAFVGGAFPGEQNLQFYSTISSLVTLRSYGFPANTLVFQRGVNFLLNNYNPFSTSIYSPYISISTIEALKGKDKVKLSQYAQLVKDAVYSSYLQDVLLFPHSKQANSKKDLIHAFFAIPTVFSIIKNSTKDELANWISPNANDKDEAFVSSMAGLYESILKIITKSYNGENSVFVLSYMADLDRYVLNGFGKKVKDGILSYINVPDLSFKTKISGKLISLQKKDGSWNWKMALSSVTFSSTPTTSQVGTSVRDSLTLQMTALSLYALMESGVSATSNAVTKGMMYLVGNLPKLLKESILPQEVSQAFETLNVYSERVFGKGYNFNSLPPRYFKNVKMNSRNLSKLLSALYIGNIRNYISQAIFQEFFGK